MDSSLVSTFIWYPNAKEVWDAIAVTFFDGNDTAQVYELRRRVSRLSKNGGSLEKFYNEARLVEGNRFLATKSHGVP